MSAALFVADLELHYGAARALRSVSIEAAPQKITAVLKRNGVGKSSMLRAIVGIHTISSGAISFGGQQQQVAIARALVTGASPLVLDKPTEGIQPSIIKDIGRALQFLRNEKGMTILLVEQYLDFCQELADHIHVMDRGEIMHSGPAADLARPEIRKHLTV